MGLDMYLVRKFYVKKWNHQKKEERFSISVRKGGKKVKIPVERACFIETEEIYWRKANAIHAWFVRNVQEGKDDCGTYYVSVEKLEELLHTITEVLDASEVIDGQVSHGQTYENGKWTHILKPGKVIKDPSTAKALLPVQSGFFFGGTEYDQWYYEDLVRTKKELTMILKENEDPNRVMGDFYYHSSW